MEYNSHNNTIAGIVLPMDTFKGIPGKPIKALNAKIITKALKDHEKSSIMQFILAIPNVPNAKPFLFCMYGTTNRFTNINVATRFKFIQNGLKARGIKMLGYGSDGDPRMISAQKLMIKYGTFHHSFGYTFSGDIYSEYQFNQDPLHIGKKMKNIIFDLGNDLVLGDYTANFGFFMILAKKYDTHITGLTKTDLDYRDRMNYK